MSAELSQQRRLECYLGLGLDDNGTYGRREVGGAVGRTLKSHFGIASARGFLSNYAQRQKAGNKDLNHADLEVDLILFHRILGYIVALGSVQPEFNAEIAGQSHPALGDSAADTEEQE